MSLPKDETEISEINYFGFLTLVSDHVPLKMSQSFLWFLHQVVNPLSKILNHFL